MNGRLDLDLLIGPTIPTAGLATLMLLTSEVTVSILVFLPPIMEKLRSNLPLPCKAIKEDARIHDPLDS